MERLSKMGKNLKNFTYDNKEIADEIYAAVNSTQFLGVSVCSANLQPLLLLSLLLITTATAIT